MTTLEPRTWSIPEVAQLLGVSRATAYRLAKTGELPVLQVGGTYKVPKDAFENYLRSCDPHVEPAEAVA